MGISGFVKLKLKLASFSRKLSWEYVLFWSQFKDILLHKKVDLDKILGNPEKLITDKDF